MFDKLLSATFFSVVKNCYEVLMNFVKVLSLKITCNGNSYTVNMTYLLFCRSLLWKNNSWTFQMAYMFSLRIWCRVYSYDCDMTYLLFPRTRFKSNSYTFKMVYLLLLRLRWKSNSYTCNLTHLHPVRLS